MRDKLKPWLSTLIQEQMELLLQVEMELFLRLANFMGGGEDRGFKPPASRTL